MSLEDELDSTKYIPSNKSDRWLESLEPSVRSEWVRVLSLFSEYNSYQLLRLASSRYGLRIGQSQFSRWRTQRFRNPYSE